MQIFFQVHENPETSPLLSECSESQVNSNQEKTFYQDIYHQNKTIPHSKVVNFKEESDFVLFDDGNEVLEECEDFDDYGETVSEYLNDLENSYSLNQAEEDLVGPWSREPLKPVNSLDLDEYR